MPIPTFAYYSKTLVSDNSTPDLSPPTFSLAPKKAVTPNKLVRTDSRTQTLDAFVDLSETQPTSPTLIRTNTVVVYKDKAKQTSLVAGEKRKRCIIFMTLTDLLRVDLEEEDMDDFDTTSEVAYKQKKQKTTAHSNSDEDEEISAPTPVAYAFDLLI